jgi:hypothetical protein
VSSIRVLPTLAVSGSGRFGEAVPTTPQPVTDDYLASRPFLEFHVRRRVRALDDANLLYGQDVTEALAMADE